MSQTITSFISFLGVVAVGIAPTVKYFFSGLTFSCYLADKGSLIGCVQQNTR